MIVVSSVWVLFLYLSFVDEVLPQLESVRTFLRGKEGVQNAIFAVTGMHLAESVLAFGIGIYSGFPLDVSLKYALSTFVFGVGALKECAKAGFTVREAKKEADDIKT